MLHLKEFNIKVAMLIILLEYALPMLLILPKLGNGNLCTFIIWIILKSIIFGSQLCYSFWNLIESTCCTYNIPIHEGKEGFLSII